MAKGSFTPRCRGREDDGKACLYDADGTSRLGICVEYGDLCCPSCAASSDCDGGFCGAYAPVSNDICTMGYLGSCIEKPCIARDGTETCSPMQRRISPDCRTDEDRDLDGFPRTTDCDDDDAERYPFAREVIGDGLDQDCDGLIDEAPNVECPGRPDMVRIGLEDCIDRYESSRSPSADDASSSVANVDPWSMVTAAEAQSACAAVGKALCTHRQWQLGCRYGTETFPYGSSHVPGACNDATSGLGRPNETGRHPQCVGPEGAYDMTGNLAEWTQEQFNGAVLVAGGSFAADADDATCGAFDLPSPESLNVGSPEIGFRCCATLGPQPAPEPDAP